MRTIAKPPPPAEKKKTERWLGRHKFGRRLLKMAGREARRLLPAWVFFYLSFSLLRLTQTAVLQDFGVSVVPPSRVLAGSLIVAKAIITVDQLRVFGHLAGRPVLISSFFRTAIYTLVIFFFLYADALFQNRALGLAAASLEFGHRLASLRFWVIQAWLVVLLFIFSAVQAFARKLGGHRFRRYLLGRVEKRSGLHP